MSEATKGFYKTQAWKRLRETYAASVGYLCERCKDRGMITPGEIVHHKTPITPENMYDENVTLNPANLKLVCRLCHAAEHAEIERGEKWSHRYTIDASGRVSASDDSPQNA